MSLKNIRAQYGVPAKRGARIAYDSQHAGVMTGTITGCDGAMRIMVRMDGDKVSKSFHPTWHIKYLGVEDGA